MRGGQFLAGIRAFVHPRKEGRTGLLNGAVGRLARVRRLFRDVNNTGPESLLRLATIGRRLELKPDTALAELDGYAAAEASMEADFPKVVDNSWRLLWDLRTAAATDKVEADP